MLFWSTHFLPIIPFLNSHSQGQALPNEYMYGTSSCSLNLHFSDVPAIPVTPFYIFTLASILLSHLPSICDLSNSIAKEMFNDVSN